MRNSKIIFFIGLAIIGVVAVLYLDYNDQYFKPHDILVEFHGLVFDLLIFGILITIYDSIKSKQEKITRYREEIKDYAGWKSDEAKYRIRGLVKRLIELKAKKVELYSCHIINCPYTENMMDWKFGNAKLYKSFFIHCNLSKSSFYLSELYESDFCEVNLTKCNFGMAILDDCWFRKCTLIETNFDYAYVTEKNWFEELKQKENIGIENILDKYIISSNSVVMNSKEYYQIIDKAHNSSTAIVREKLVRDNIKNYRPQLDI